MRDDQLPLSNKLSRQPFEDRWLEQRFDHSPFLPMVIFLRILFGVVLLSMLAVTSWASRHTSLFAIPADVVQHPWFIATLFDAYWAFIAFFVWVAWKEQSLAARILWFIAIVALGNISIAAYFLRELSRVRSPETVDTVFTHRNPGALTLPLVLTVISVAVYLVA